MEDVIAESHDINSLISRDVSGNQPMYRLLGGKNSMTFTDPTMGGRYWGRYLIPEAITSGFGNMATHLSGDGPANSNYINAVTGLMVGVAAGVTVQDYGTCLVPSYSSMAYKSPILNSIATDVRRVQYDAAFSAKKSDVLDEDLHALETFAGLLFITSNLPLSKETKAILKVPILFGGAAYLATTLVNTTVKGVSDIDPSHRAPTLASYQSQWKGPPSTYSTVNGSSTTVTPYLMEDFLYEKPFVTLKVTNANDVLEKNSLDYDKDKYDSLGLYGSNKLSLATIAPSITTATKLNFQNNPNWEKLGLKKDTWTHVEGVKESVPIRHVDRYASHGTAPLPILLTFLFQNGRTPAS